MRHSHALLMVARVLTAAPKYSEAFSSSPRHQAGGGSAATSPASRLQSFTNKTKKRLQKAPAPVLQSPLVDDGRGCMQRTILDDGNASLLPMRQQL